jgi:nucleotide-binding universal stress UspA family protein
VAARSLIFKQLRDDTYRLFFIASNSRVELMKNILIATDSSKHSKKASEVGIEMAMLFGAKVTTLYVIDVGKECASIGVLESNEGDDLISRIRSSLQSQGEEATGRIEEMAKSAGLTVDRVIIEGRPAEDILKLAGERNGSHSCGRHRSYGPGKIPSGQRGREGGTQFQGACISGAS